MVPGGVIEVDHGGVAGVDEVFSWQQSATGERVVDPGRARESFSGAGALATSVMTLVCPSSQVSVMWAKYPFQ